MTASQTGSGPGLRGVPGYARVLLASSTSGLGDGLVVVALPLLVAAQTDQPVLVGAVAATQRVPWVLFSLHGGALVDRLRLDRLLPGIEAVRAVVLAALTAAVVVDTAVLPLVFVAAFVVGTGDTVVASGLQAAIPRMVSPALLDRANTGIFISQGTTEHLAGPAVGGLLYAVTSALPFGIDALSFAVSGALLVTALPGGVAAGSAGQRLTEDVGEGLRWFRRQAALVRMTLLLMAFSACQAAVLAMLVFLVTDRYGGSEATYGIVLAMAAVGNLVGALFTDRVARRTTVSRILLVGGGLTGIAYVVMGITTSPVVAGACLAVEGLAVGIANVAALGYRQRLIPPAMLGRVSAIVRLFTYGVIPVGALLAGVATQALDVGTVFVGIGVLQTVITLLTAPALPPITREGPAAAGG